MEKDLLETAAMLISIADRIANALPVKEKEIVREDNVVFVDFKGAAFSDVPEEQLELRPL